ncbi:PEP-CTERM sorting domain-containing protein [Nostoc sp. FACHB-152]|uniref:PEP-CTERM sorting domain-containing protein n=1 Tax=unclassified Nostoc TaxID=2593658 RepID=UPI001682D9F2|nr:MULTISPECIES: PEP-CTERM sorting domain-containing protein [unclassified Nostoc]MBD2448388.1 PEP-CTERM sorting domain-containing protein [Nostoc sp. FACHB-152]MBD2470828.1 PEP-CTERM sorting domain-containing protein [Nostoc sp. FACHB-145]
MLTTTFKKLSQATAVTALGIAMLASVGNAPAHAVNLQTFNLSGQFASQALNGSTGIAVDLQNGFFDGSYTVDTDLLPTTTQVSLSSWIINLKDASNNILKTFSSSTIGNTGLVVNDGLLFTNKIASSKGQETASLGLVFAPGFTSPVGGASDGLFSSVVFKKGTIVSGQLPIKAVPEPLSTTGIAVAGAMGLWMKRKQKAPVA